MTDDPRPDDDPTRALDRVHVPDQWADITSRAARPTTGFEGLPRNTATTRRPYVLAAAVVLVAAAIATGLVLTQRDDGRDQVVAGPSAGGRLDDPANAAGRRWALTSFAHPGSVTAWLTSDPGGERPITNPVDGIGPPTLDLSVPGDVTFRGCNAGGGPGTVEGDRLVVGREWFSTLAACAGPNGEGLMALDEAMANFLRSDPTIELASDRLTLRSGSSVAEFVELRGGSDDTPAPGGGDDPGEPTATSSGSVPDGGTATESRVPDTESVPVHLTEPPLGLRTWVLVSIEEPGPGGSVTDPVDTEHGGGDGSGGAPALVIGDRTSVVFEGCDIVPLATETRGVDPWLRLTPGQSSCAGDANHQHNQILKLLSVGVVPRVHETVDGLVLVLANEEGTLVFRDATGGN